MPRRLKHSKIEDVTPKEEECPLSFHCSVTIHGFSKSSIYLVNVYYISTYAQISSVNVY